MTNIAGKKNNSGKRRFFLFYTVSLSVICALLLLMALLGNAIQREIIGRLIGVVIFTCVGLTYIIFAKILIKHYPDKTLINVLGLPNHPKTYRLAGIIPLIIAALLLIDTIGRFGNK